MCCNVRYARTEGGVLPPWAAPNHNSPDRLMHTPEWENVQPTRMNHEVVARFTKREDEKWANHRYAVL